MWKNPKGISGTLLGENDEKKEREEGRCAQMKMDRRSNRKLPISFGQCPIKRQTTASNRQGTD